MLQQWQREKTALLHHTHRKLSLMLRRCESSDALSPSFCCPALQSSLRLKQRQRIHLCEDDANLQTILL